MLGLKIFLTAWVLIYFGLVVHADEFNGRMLKAAFSLSIFLLVILIFLFSVIHAIWSWP